MRISTYGVGKLGSSIVKIVVVDVELGAGVRLTSSPEGKVDELLAEDTVEYAVTECTVVFEHLVDNILMVGDLEQGPRGWPTTCSPSGTSFPCSGQQPG